jgi:hypothetical protein
MDLKNETPFAARILRFQPGEEAEVQSTVVVKATFERSATGAWVPAGEQVPIVDDQLETPFGSFHTDCFVRKEGVDLCVLGTIRLASAVKAAQLVLTAGRLSHTLTVHGDRKWVRSGGSLVPSSPGPFTEMPLAYSRAYGGVTQLDHEAIAWPDNPVGRGYYLSAGQAEQNLLPNIEAAESPPVKQWSDQPRVAGWGPYPCFWGMRAREGVEPPASQKAGVVGRIKARLNNQAHTSLIVPSLDADAEIRIRGMRADELVYSIPSTAPIVEVRLGDQVTSATGQLDGIFLWVDQGRATFTHRIHFSYPYRKGQPRRARLIDSSSLVTGS